jgi:uncharacterized hydrophobic protein (TIGR00271 family)
LASFGLNVNSSAVVIGAMLISPLMGPIMGIGLGASINDFTLLKKSAMNFLFATVTSLITSTLYFSFSPLNEAHAELLARTSPNIYDVFIALAGGFSGIIAISGHNRGNVLPGVAIATALMPPLCTTGYGLATGQWKFVLGALYLFLINGVFIALATYLFARFIRFPLVHDRDRKVDKRHQRIILILTISTLIPSIYLSYQLINNSRYNSSAEKFIQQEIAFRGAVILNKTIDAQKGHIKLYIAGNPITDKDQDQINQQLSKYGLSETHLELFQGQGLNEIRHSLSDLEKKVDQKRTEEVGWQYLIDSIAIQEKQWKDVSKELPMLFPGIRGVFRNTTGNILLLTESNRSGVWIDTARINTWLKHRLSTDSIKLIIAK